MKKNFNKFNDNSNKSIKNQYFFFTLSVNTVYDKGKGQIWKHM